MKLSPIFAHTSCNACSNAKDDGERIDFKHALKIANYTGT